jgi:hypothetical protein
MLNSMAHDPDRTLTRRRFLVSTSAAMGTLALGAGSTLTGCSEPLDPPTLAAVFPTIGVLAAGVPQRMAFSIIDPGEAAGVVALPADDQSVEVRLVSNGDVIDEIVVSSHVLNHDHDDDDGEHSHADLRRYYPARFTIPDAGVYALEVMIPNGAAFGQAVPARLEMTAYDRSEVSVILPGDNVPAVETPTFANPAGVDHLCTRAEPCPFHEQSFSDVIGNGRPTALLLATAAYCHSGHCPPALDALVEAGAQVAGVDIVHAEIFSNPDEVDGNIVDPAIRKVPAMEALGLSFAPSLLLVNAAGTLVDRLDIVFDVDEATAVLTTLASS